MRIAEFKFLCSVIQESNCMYTRGYGKKDSGGFLSGFGLLGSGKEEENRVDLICLFPRFHSILHSMTSMTSTGELSYYFRVCLIQCIIVCNSHHKQRPQERG